VGISRGSVSTAGDLDRIPAPLLVVAAAVSVQIGAAIAVKLFADVGPLGAVWLRLAISAVVMVVVSRPALRSSPPGAIWWAVAFGVVLAAMNTAFYFAIARISLGPAVTIEFIGPLAVAVAGSRRLLDLLWVVLAAAGVVLLAGADGGGGSHSDAVGLGLAAVAGACWSAYILLSQRVGRTLPGATGLSIALTVGAVALAPAALARHARDMANLGVLGAGIGVAMLSSALPYSLELAALRRMRAATFGVVLSLDPAVAALAGLVVLRQQLRWTEWVALGCVVLASAGASLRGRPPAVDPAPLPPQPGQTGVENAVRASQG
jgi:inner membrane transporter RhtA